MADEKTREAEVPPEMVDHYTRADEKSRLTVAAGLVERARTGEMMCRHLPPPPARILDVGGGPGVHALPLATAGYEVHLIDAVPRHVEQAKEASAGQPAHPLASVRLGDARRLPEADGGFDAVLLLGPLYHLTDARDREGALREAFRVLKPGGVLFAAAISRFASMLDGLYSGRLRDPAFAAIVEGDLRDGIHLNPDGRLDWFTTAYFHRPEDLRAEVAGAGFDLAALVGLEGPLWTLADIGRQWADAAVRDRYLGFVRTVEGEPSLLGLSAHLLAVGRKGA